MSDITMCRSKTCGIREHCYRYTAIPNFYMQSYFMDTSVDVPLKTDGCCMFWPVEDVVSEANNEGDEQLRNLFH